MVIDFDDFSITCNIQYGKRKTIAVHIEPSGLIIIKAPNKTPEENIVEAVKPLGNRIKKRLDELDVLRSKFSPKTYNGEGKFMYLGKEYPLDKLVDIDGLNEEEKKHELKKFYTREARKIIGERIGIYERELKVKAKEYKIDEAKSRWGSCTSSKKLTFNYRLAMAPMDCIDYVVVHELCHLKHMNHDRSFWRLVGSILPDYKNTQEYLKKYGQFMTL